MPDDSKAMLPPSPAARRRLWILLICLALVLGANLGMAFSRGRPHSSFHRSRASVLQKPAPPAGGKHLHMAVRTSADFEPLSGILIGVRKFFPEHEQVFVDIVRALREDVPLFAVTANPVERLAAFEVLERNGLLDAGVHLVEIPVQTKWMRDYGPIFGRTASGKPLILDTLYSCADPAGTMRHSDDMFPSALAAILKIRAVPVPLVLDGGDLLTNGEGYCLTSSNFVNENGGNDGQLEQLVAAMTSTLGARGWCYLQTPTGERNMHVDMFVALLAKDLAVVSQVPDALSPNDAGLFDRAAELIGRHRTSVGPMRVVRLPVPAADADGSFRSYTNIIQGNRVVLVPVYDHTDPVLQREALNIYRQLLPGKRIIPIPSDTLVKSRGSLHCLTVNIPAFVSVAPLVALSAELAADG